MLPACRQPVVDAYWNLAFERQRIYHGRLAGLPGPWTDDDILQEYKFCNAFRASDRVSQYLIRDIIYVPREYGAEDQLLRIILFRLFSKPATWQLLCDAFGDVTIETFDPQAYGSVLDDAFASGRRLYTAAFILCANRAYGHDRKHRNHLALIEAMLAPGGLSASVAAATRLSDLYVALASYPLIGPFMAYQLAIDINYSELCDFSEDEWSVAGPGARRGIAKCFTDTAGWDDRRIIAWMTERQDDEFARLGLDFADLHGRPLHAIDIQNLFCETDKYARVRFPELKSERSRIKARFRPTGPLPAPFYPPKWKLDLPPSDRSAANDEARVPADQGALF